MSDELKPCPFCGGGVHWEDEMLDVVRCFRCTADGPWSLGAGKSEAIAAWNTRAELERLTAENARLNAECVRLSKDCQMAMDRVAKLRGLIEPTEANVERVALAIGNELLGYCRRPDGTSYAVCDNGPAPDGGWFAEVDGEFNTYTLAEAALTALDPET
jgi:hypothetical protein